MQTTKEILQQSKNYLEQKEHPSPRFHAERMLMHILNIDRLTLYLDFERPVEPKELQKLRNYLKRLVQGEPWQYIEGRVPFFHMEFEVNRHVLIPRPETEWIVEKVVEEVNSERTKVTSVLDLCTGSGCIGLSIKNACPNLSVTLSDLDEKALGVAKTNQIRQGLEVELVQGDLFEPLKGKKFDIIVSNPPYVTDQEYLELDSKVRDFEPKRALVAGADGLDLYRRIAREYQAHLNPGGRLYLEIGETLGNQLLELFSGRGEILSDLAGKPRLFLLENE